MAYQYQLLSNSLAVLLLKRGAGIMGHKNFLDFDDDSLNIGLSENLLSGDDGLKFRMNDHIVLDEETGEIHLGISFGDTEEDEQ